MKRRRWVLAAGAAGAAALGVGAWQWRARPGDPADALWSLHFERLQGSPLALAGFRGQPLLINFWATWCPPCVRELPLIDRFQREQRARGWRVVGLAVDQRAPVLDFLSRQPVGFEVGLAGMDGIELARTLGNAGGALPFTVVVDSSGRVVHRKLGTILPDDLKAWAASAT